MSASGTKRTFRPCCSMSAFGGKADMPRGTAGAADAFFPSTWQPEGRQIKTFMKFISLLVGMSIKMLIALCSSAVVVRAQPTTPPVIAPAPRLTLTAEQEYVIREIILKDVNVPKEKAGSGDSVPENVTLYPLPSEIEQKVPKAKSHKFFVRDDDTIILVSPSDRRIADVL